jgi:sporulation-control protein
MSLVGIGSAQIDLILPKTIFKPGELIKGYFRIEGGTVEQQIKRIDCDLMLTDSLTGKTKVIDTATILTSKHIHPGETSQIAFSFKLEEYLPLSSNEQSYRFKTRLTFNEGVESKDQDPIQINI